MTPLPEFPSVPTLKTLPARGELRRMIENSPADAGKSQRLALYIKGPKGAVQFVVYRFKLRGVDKTLPADLGYHSPVPMYANHSAMRGQCHLLDGGTCYYDGSGLAAHAFYAKAQAQESADAVWAMLEEYYHEVFDDVALPVPSVEDDVLPVPGAKKGER